MDINDAELGKNQPAIVRERTEGDGEVEYDDPVRLQFLDCQILQSGAMGTLVFRGCHSDCFPDCARSSSSARIGTPRFSVCTPCTTQIFRTSMISSVVAPALSAL